MPNFNAVSFLNLLPNATPFTVTCYGFSTTTFTSPPNPPNAWSSYLDTVMTTFGPDSGSAVGPCGLSVNTGCANVSDDAYWHYNPPSDLPRTSPQYWQAMYYFISGTAEEPVLHMDGYGSPRYGNATWGTKKG
ncbi:hypothetical protein LTR66_000295 [Elasticomyces elasticus]|nr:hypothetical protein LTR50_006502 [Elasticomyces elasticus]KAK5000949.1 hypothetical protein LTR66_000295 [Elasticomyces elasticus]